MKQYNEYVDKQAKKLMKNSKGKVYVEDDYIEPNDFRDPGGRKKRDNSNDEPSPLSKKRGSTGSKSIKPPTTGTGSLAGRKNSRSPSQKNDSNDPNHRNSDLASTSQVGGNNRDIGKPPKSPAASAGMRM